jgi:putative nucleotidyltransferase with HDIG domain
MNRDTVTELIRKPTLSDLRERMRETDTESNHSLVEHGRRVAGIALVIAAEWGFHPLTNTVFLEELRLAGEFHDVGKILLPADAAPETMERHVELGATLLREAGAPEAVVDAALYHHVRYAGGGYPDTMLSGDALPLTARIVAVADELAARTEDRPQRAGRPVHDVWADLFANRGARFDPHIVDTLERSTFLKEALRLGALPDSVEFLKFNRYPIGVAA